MPALPRARRRGREDPDFARRTFDVNLMGVLNSLQPLIGPMIARKRGQLVIMSSLASFRGFAGSAAYCASKAAVRIWGEACATNWRDMASRSMSSAPASLSAG